MSTDHLTKLGFTKRESTLYRVLLTHGRLTATEAAKLTGISRPTVYSVAKELIRKGVITEDVGGSSRIYVAQPPQSLVVLANREERRLEEKRTLIAGAVKELESIALSDKYSVPKLVFIQEEQLDDYLYKQSENWNASMKKRDGIFWGFQDQTFPEQFEKWIDWYWQKKPSIILQLVSNQSPIEQKMEQKGYGNRRIRFSRKSTQFTGTTWVMGDYVVMIATRHHPFYLVEIHDELFAENLRNILKDAWEGSKE